MSIAVGDKIPTFSLESQQGEFTTVSATDGQKKVIYFYPKNETKVCTAQACSFRDWQEEFVKRKYIVFGISSDTVSSHRDFHSRHKLNFTLLSDEKGKVRKQFGATTFLGLIPSRKTFLVNKEGIVTFIYEGLFEAEKHVKEVLKALETKA